MQVTFWDPIQALFLDTGIGGYLGPLILLIAGFHFGKRDKLIALLFFVVECLMIYQYAQLLSATPNYIWQIFILLMGVISSAFRMMSK